jgi:F-type H+-transporting ATPase subunit alpha
MKANHGDLLDKINDTGDYSDEIQAGLKAVAEEFIATGAY